jgi:uncharacterized protein YciI
MLFLRLSLDKPGSIDLRTKVRPEHRAYLDRHLAPEVAVRVVEGGPLSVSEADPTNNGSFMVLEASSHADVVAFHEADPFTKAGLYETTQILVWTKTI